MRLSIKLSGIVAVGGVAALGAGLISSGGIGAAFTDQATATADITTGTIACEFQDLGNGVTYSQDSSNKWHNATVKLADIQSSTGTESNTVRVKNTGTMPVNVTWSVSPSGSLFYNYGVTNASFMALPTLGKATLLPGHSEDANIGFAWANLDNHYLTGTGTATYTIHCEDGPQFGAHGAHKDGLWLFDNDGAFGASATWNAEDQTVSLTTTSAGGSAAGIRMLVASGSALPKTAPEFIAESTPDTVNLKWLIYFNDPAMPPTLPYVITYHADGSWVTSYRTSTAPPDFVSVTGNSWNGLVDYVNNHTNWTFGQASLTQNNGSSGGISTVTCVDYTGTPLFGDC